MSDSHSIALCNLNPGEVRVEFLQCLMETWVGDHNDRRLISHIRAMVGGPLISIYRNQAVEWFLTDTNADWLLFIDSDIVWKLSDIYTLYDCADHSIFPVVAGVYPMVLPEGVRAGIFTYDKDQNPVPWETVPDNEMIPADGVGAGFLLLSRSLLNAMKDIYPHAEPWFTQYASDTMVYGEDFSFCMRVKQMGYPTMVNTAVQLAHIKKTALTIDSMSSYKEKLDVS